VADLIDNREQACSFVGLASYQRSPNEAHWKTGAGWRRNLGAFFEALGVAPVAGPGFLAEDDRVRRPGRDSAQFLEATVPGAGLGEVRCRPRICLQDLVPGETHRSSPTEQQPRFTDREVLHLASFSAFNYDTPQPVPAVVDSPQPSTRITDRILVRPASSTVAGALDAGTELRHRLFIAPGFLDGYIRLLERFACSLNVIKCHPPRGCGLFPRLYSAAIRCCCQSLGLGGCTRAG
jgi:hypothetical protein